METHERKYYGREAMRLDGVLVFILTDHLGSTSVFTDDSGGYLASQGYDAWGATRYTHGTVLTDKLYTGQRLSGDLGLYDYKARWYDPIVGRFLMEDPIIPKQGVMRLERFAYVDNSPLYYTDASGYRIDDGCWTEGCSGDPNATVHGVLIGGLPAIQPFSGYQSYSEDAEQGWYYPSQLSNPVTGKTNQSDTRIVNAFVLAVDIGAFYQTKEFLNEERKIKIWLYYQESSNNFIDVQAIKVNNATYNEIAVVNVYFSSQRTYDPCAGLSCYSLPDYHYASNPTRITNQSDVLSQVPGKSSSVIGLSPSGYLYNPNNSFPAYQAVTISVRLGYISPGGDRGTEWPLVRYTIPTR